MIITFESGFYFGNLRSAKFTEKFIKNGKKLLTNVFFYGTISNVPETVGFAFGQYNGLSADRGAMKNNILV